MKIINLICLLLALSLVYSVITETQINQTLADCHDSENFPYNTQDASLRMLQDQYEDYKVEYLCEDSCITDFQSYLQDLYDINAAATDDDGLIKPCNIWWDYEDDNLNYNASDLDTEKLQKYVTCLFEMSYLSIEYPFWDILSCTGLKIEQMLNGTGAVQIGIIAASDAEQCEVQCESDTGCSSGTDCYNYISDNFDMDQEKCVEALQAQTQDNNDGITQNADDFSEYASELYIECIYDNIYMVDEFSNYGFDIDWDTLYDSGNFGNNYELDYSVFGDTLSDENNAILTLSCQVDCYYYWQYFEESDIEYFDNSWVFEELYGADIWEDFEGFEEIEVFWDEEDYQYVDCKGGDCIDEAGNFIGTFEDGQENPCDSEYCFVELFGCIEKCSNKHCPKDTCYEKSEGQNFEFYAENLCKDMKQLSEVYEAEGIFELNAVVPIPYIATYSGCMKKLTDNETASDRDATKKGYILGFYTCLTECVSDDTLEQENNPNSQSRLLMLFYSLLISTLLMI